MAGVPTTVDIRHFDAGIVYTLGAVVVQVPDEKIGQSIPVYGVYVAGVEGPPHMPRAVIEGQERERLIPVSVVPPEISYVPDRLPEFTLRPADPSPALERYHPYAHVRYPTPGAAELTLVNSRGETVQGFSSYTVREAAMPFDMTYDLELRAPKRNAAVRMLMYTLKRYPPYGSLKLMDSGRCMRTYEAFMEGTANISELGGVFEREVGWSVTIRVAGELDLGYDTARAPVKVGVADIDVFPTADQAVLDPNP